MFGYSKYAFELLEKLKKINFEKYKRIKKLINRQEYHPSKARDEIICELLSEAEKEINND